MRVFSDRPRGFTGSGGEGGHTRFHQQLTCEGQGQFTPEGAIGHVNVDAQTSTLSGTVVISLEILHRNHRSSRGRGGMAVYLVGTNALEDTLEGFQAATEVISSLRAG